MLLLQIGLPTGRYCAASHANPGDPEWPPHPSRVFSALVAGAYDARGTLATEERDALDALAAAGPPAMSFPDADVSPAPRAYVPVNDIATRLTRLNKERTLNASVGVLEPNRQPRQFPSAFLLGEPEVSLLWDIELPANSVAALDRIASRMTHLGTSHTFVTARFSAPKKTARPRWIPDRAGTDYLRVPLAGRLEELDAHVAATRDGVRRHQSLRESLVAYGPSEPPHPAVVPAQHDWVALRLHDASWGADTAHTLARAARRALMSLVGDAAPAALHGHDGATDHLAWLPLPDVGHKHAAGRIRGLAVGFPKSLPAQEVAVLLRALQRLEQLRLPDGQVARLTPVVNGADALRALRTDTWCRASTEWSTVTPVLLDRPPKRADADRLVAAMAESLTNAGHPPPLEVRLMRSSEFEGAPPALAIPTGLPRYHARVRFAQPVEGPVLAGRWRNFGIGLFRPIASEAQT